jgi:hypothetical protein
MNFAKTSYQTKRKVLEEDDTLLPSVDSPAGKSSEYLVKLQGDKTLRLSKSKLERMYRALKSLKFKITADGLVAAMLINVRESPKFLEETLLINMNYLPDVPFMMLILINLGDVPFPSILEAANEVIAAQNNTNNRTVLRSRVVGDSYGAMAYDFGPDADAWMTTMNEYGSALRWMERAPKTHAKLAKLIRLCKKTGTNLAEIVAATSLTDKQLHTVSQFAELMELVHNHSMKKSALYKAPEVANPVQIQQMPDQGQAQQRAQQQAQERAQQQAQQIQQHIQQQTQQQEQALSALETQVRAYGSQRGYSEAQINIEVNKQKEMWIGSQSTVQNNNQVIN